jgi:hypothetical protein
VFSFSSPTELFFETVEAYGRYRGLGGHHRERRSKGDSVDVIGLLAGAASVCQPRSLQRPLPRPLSFTQILYGTCSYNHSLFPRKPVWIDRWVHYAWKRLCLCWCCGLEFSENHPTRMDPGHVWERTILGAGCSIRNSPNPSLRKLSAGWFVVIFPRGAVRMMLDVGCFCCLFESVCPKFVLCGRDRDIVICSFWNSSNPSINRMSAC